VRKAFKEARRRKPKEIQDTIQNRTSISYYQEYLWVEESEIPMTDEEHRTLLCYISSYEYLYSQTGASQKTTLHTITSHSNIGGVCLNS